MNRRPKLRKRVRAMRKKLAVESLESRVLLAGDLANNLTEVDDILDANGANQENQNRPQTVDIRDAGPNQLERTRRRGGDRGEGSPVLEWRSFDGTGNNLVDSEWGSAGNQLLRHTATEYADGIDDPAGEERASAREISNLVFDQEELTPNEAGLSDLVWQWGQFLDHDIDLTGHDEFSDSFAIDVPAGDEYFDPTGSGDETIHLARSVYDPSTGDSVDNPRQQINQITAFIDGSNIYGSDEERASALRTFEGGRLKTSEGDLLPFNVDGLDNAGGTDSSLFVAGDVRANEQAGLTAMHTLWVREHNRIADSISDRHPELSDEEVFQRARSIVIAELQVITYNEFLPALLGEDAIPEYQGYDASVDPGISNVFSTAAYRFGHSMLSPELLRLDNDGQVIEDGNLALRDAFFRPDEITDNGIDSLLNGLANQRAQEIDAMLVDDVRNFLFGPPGSGGFDLASLNIQRGRDHGLADYNEVRVAYGLEPVESFADITDDVEVQAALEEAYGDVNEIDVWVGGLAEDHVDGGSVGELVQAVLVDQFTRLRDGDRFWYQNQFSDEQLRQIERTTLADVMSRNTELTNLQDHVFYTPDAQPESNSDDQNRPPQNRPPAPQISDAPDDGRHDDHRDGRRTEGAIQGLPNEIEQFEQRSADPAENEIPPPGSIRPEPTLAPQSRPVRSEPLHERSRRVDEPSTTNPLNSVDPLFADAADQLFRDFT